MGVPVEIAREDGSIGGDVARLIDFANMEANDWLAVNQYTVIEHGRRTGAPTWCCSSTVSLWP